ncbi:MAG: cytochrome b/b6 domain-containing protein [Pseudomonadales bacterium]|nr:cytochrome b/b6 domain-containing protein [Pseudomonadales bacterium]
MKKILVWDLPVRVFHWALLVLVVFSFVTGTLGGFTIMDYHMWSGYAILALILFRIGWGFVGGSNARFANFIASPARTIHYARTLRSAGPSVGHNPLGALSIVALLLSLAVQVATGLFANDDILLEGPLAHLVSYDTSRWLTGIHETNRWIIVALVTLHVAAIAYYQFIKRDNLLAPMITGRKEVPDDLAPEPNNWLRGAILLAATGGIVYLLVTYV